jgi:Peptidase family M1 domain
MFLRLLTAIALPLCAFGQVELLANYTLSARLDPASKAVTGHELLIWTNHAPDPVSELQFHLYMNAFKNEKSTFMRESGGQLRGDTMRKDNWGYIDVRKFQLVGGPDLTRSMQFIHPDDNNADDQTVFRVPLPAPVPPGGTIQLAIDFYTKFPHVFARAGYHGNFFLGGQWFPKIGVLEKPGERYATKTQWNCHQYHATSEFYSDYGTYNVDLTVPSEYVVGATGVLRNTTQNPDHTTTYTFFQSNVHDFAWTAQPGFVRFERMFRADQVVSPAELDATARRFGITRDQARLTDVKMILLLQPEHAWQADRHFKALTNAIKYFGLWYSHYPHQTITVVDPPYGGEGAAGMEYPTFITAGTTWLLGRNDGSPEEVIIHEFGHQFWQGQVGTNEFEEAWMDEGFNTYSTGKVLDVAYGRRDLPLHRMGIPLTWFIQLPTIDSDETNRAAYLLAPKADDLARNAWQYLNVTSYGINSYMRTAVMMRTLENYLGEEAMAKIMRAYQVKWRFRHPAMPDFIKMVNDGSGRDMSWFFNQYVYGSNLVDYAVGGVSSEPEHTLAGMYDKGDGRITISAEDAAKADKKQDKKKQLYDCKVTIRRLGDATFPVDVLIRFENGETIRKQWDGQYRWTRFEFTKPSKVASVVIDPDHKVLLDADFSNNSWVEKPKRGATVKISATLLFFVQELLQTIGAIA